MEVQFKTRKTTDYIVVHCAATRPSMDIGAREIRQWHKRDNGWLDIGYHFVIRRDGTIEEGRKVDQVGAHVKDYNSISLGICLVGGVDDELKPQYNFTKEQEVSLKAKLQELKKKYPVAAIKGHRDFDSGKACPSFDVAKWLKEHNV